MAYHGKHKTAKGRPIDWEKIRRENSNTVAVGGSVHMNARGDVLGQGGQVIKTREELDNEYNVDNPNAVRLVSIKEDEIGDEESLQQPSPQQSFEKDTSDQQEYMTPQEALENIEKSKGNKESSSKTKSNNQSKRKIVDSNE